MDKLDKDYGIQALPDFIGKNVHVSISDDNSGFTVGCTGKLSKHELGWMINDGNQSVAIFSEEAIESFKFVFRGAYDQITLKIAGLSHLY